MEFSRSWKDVFLSRSRARVVTSVFPSERGVEVQRKYNEIQQKFPLPPFVKQKQMGVRWIKEGLKGVTVYGVEKGKVADALNFVYRYEGEFAGIEGYSNDIETLLENWKN